MRSTHEGTYLINTAQILTQKRAGVVRSLSFLRYKINIDTLPYIFHFDLGNRNWDMAAGGAAAFARRVFRHEGLEFVQKRIKLFQLCDRRGRILPEVLAEILLSYAILLGELAPDLLQSFKREPPCLFHFIHIPILSHGHHLPRPFYLEPSL